MEGTTEERALFACDAPDFEAYGGTVFPLGDYPPRDLLILSERAYLSFIGERARLWLEYQMR